MDRRDPAQPLEPLHADMRHRANAGRAITPAIPGVPCGFQEGRCRFAAGGRYGGGQQQRRRADQADRRQLGERVEAQSRRAMVMLPLINIARVWASVALANRPAARLPPAPGRFSTSTGCPRTRVSGSARARAVRSGEEPAGNPTNRRTGRVGHSRGLTAHKVPGHRLAVAAPSAAVNVRRRTIDGGWVGIRRAPARWIRAACAADARIIDGLVACPPTAMNPSWRVSTTERC